MNGLTFGSKSDVMRFKINLKLLINMQVCYILKIVLEGIILK